VASRAWLSDQQKHRAARIAQEKGLTCTDCGSSEPVPEDEARAHLGGGADIAMRCVNYESTQK
jgi:threonine dehydrogenase-like Zn-dependent dehydrogenase